MIPHWYVVFAPSRDSPWWVRWLTRPGFRHVWAFGFDVSGGVWVLVEPQWTHLMVRTVPRAWVDAWLAAEELTVVRFAPVAEGARRPRLVVTCAGAVAALVGLGGSNCLPETLYRNLLRRGAVPARLVR